MNQITNSLRSTAALVSETKTKSHFRTLMSEGLVGPTIFRRVRTWLWTRVEGRLIRRQEVGEVLGR